jgi:hypothetical protein
VTGKTSGVEVRAHLRRLVWRIRKRWPKTLILFRSDGHYTRPEAMARCETNDVDYVIGLSTQSRFRERLTRRRTPFAQCLLRA